MKKFAPAVVIASLIAAIVVYAQPTPVISFGPVVTVFNTTSTGAVNGSTYALPGGNANVLTWQLVPVGGPSAISASLQVSLDGTNWITLSTCTTTTGCIYNAGVNAYTFVRTIQTSRTGGTSTTASIATTRAYGLANGSNPILSGNLLFSPDGTYDIGASGANRPRIIYTSSSIIAGGNIASSGFYNFNGGARLSNGSVSGHLLTDSTGAAYGLLQFGGTTNSFPAFRRNGTQFDVRLADDSNSSGMAMQYTAYNSTAFASLGTPGDGTVRYCNDCTFANPCASGGTGAIAKRLAGAWRCD